MVDFLWNKLKTLQKELAIHTWFLDTVVLTPCSHFLDWFTKSAISPARTKPFEPTDLTFLLA